MIRASRSHITLYKSIVCGSGKPTEGERDDAGDECNDKGYRQPQHDYKSGIIQKVDDKRTEGGSVYSTERRDSYAVCR